MVNIAKENQIDIAIYSDDRYLRRSIEYHFSEEKTDPDFTGWTYLSGRTFGGTKFVAIERDGTKRVYSVDAATFYSPEFDKFDAKKISKQAEYSAPSAKRLVL